MRKIQTFASFNKIRKFLSFEQVKRLSEAYIVPTFTYCLLLWMFCGEIGDWWKKSINAAYVLYMKWKMQILKIY